MKVSSWQVGDRLAGANLYIPEAKETGRKTRYASVSRGFTKSEAPVHGNPSDLA